ncbi:hypothetical protein AMTR_s00037p00206160 [Amborella trichopoda]|uniref:Uncharacterized protein n=1 Tax=Amborella trichopoda TaxID=13333 RepID=U5DAG9_AMBTC|nr:hypothetical protein AMTR_s00037p00206160 [Amborella trichopoda]
MENKNVVRGSTPNPWVAMFIETGRNHPSNLQVCRPTIGPTSSSSDGIKVVALDTALKARGKVNLDPDKVSHLRELVNKLCCEVDHCQYMAGYHESKADHAR